MGFFSFVVREVLVVLLVVGGWCSLACGSFRAPLGGGEGVPFGVGGGGCRLFLSAGGIVVTLGVGSASGAVGGCDDAALSRAPRSCTDDTESCLCRGRGMAKSLPTMAINAWI